MFNFPGLSMSGCYRKTDHSAVPPKKPLYYQACETGFPDYFINYAKKIS
jgi:hypothetical protein